MPRSTLENVRKFVDSLGLEKSRELLTGVLLRWRLSVRAVDARTLMSRNLFLRGSKPSSSSFINNARPQEVLIPLVAAISCSSGENDIVLGSGELFDSGDEGADGRSILTAPLVSGGCGGGEVSK
jgi:hypothetical protein